MLITFTCSAYANITMFGDVATQLIKYMGHSGQVPSALTANDVPVALQKLQAAIEANSQYNPPHQPSGDMDEEPVVSLSHRALPLIELLKAAEKAECDVMWDRNT
jgi:hypothetical protein